MASDLRVVDAPLRKETCERCGLVRTAGGPHGVHFGEGYTLYAHAPAQGVPERTRQARYADWIASMASTSPAAVLDAGCGNGSLLLALRERWPAARLYGCDPSRDGVRHGQTAGLMLWASSIAGVPADVRADLIVTVNVIEHIPDPLAFLQELRGRVIAGGRLIVTCPDGARPDVELLVSDHVHSFTASHLAILLTRAGWSPRLVEAAPAALGAFQAVVADAAAPMAPGPVPAADAALLDRRRRFFAQWAALDDALLARTGDARLACFGTGEAAGLLRVYARRTWQRVYTCTADEAGAATECYGLPVTPIDTLPPGVPILLGVRAQDQRAVADRLRQRFDRVVAWYDLVEA